MKSSPPLFLTMERPEHHTSLSLFARHGQERGDIAEKAEDSWHTHHALCDDKEGHGASARWEPSCGRIASTHARDGSVQGLVALGCKQGVQQGGEVFGAVWRRGLKFRVSNEFFSARRQVRMVVRILVVLGTARRVQRRGQKGVLSGVSVVMTSFTSGIIAIKIENAIYSDLSHEFSSHFRHTKNFPRR